MALLWILGAALQCALLFWLWCVGMRALRHPAPAAPDVQQWGPQGGVERLPKVALFVPCAGAHPAMPTALRSLATQDYPKMLLVLITADAADPASALAGELRAAYPHVRHVLAGAAEGCGQKNHNLLRGMAAHGDWAEVYAFADSTHVAAPDFVRQLVWPIACGECPVATGYHRVVAQDAEPVTLAYQICVLLMRLLQGIGPFTQPWGGAMAVSRQAFERYAIADFWRDKVVDDCSLAAHALQRGLHVRQCPHALLDTPAAHHPLAVWEAWLDRQVLFLKFCIPPQWWLLGVLALCMTLPPLASAFAVLGSLFGLMPPSGAWLTLGGVLHLGLLLWLLMGWRELTGQAPAPLYRWVSGFALACAMFARVYLRTLTAKSIDWHGFRYHVGKQGRVERRERL